MNVILPQRTNNQIGMTGIRKEGKYPVLFLAKQKKESGKPLPKLYIWCGTEDFIYDLSVSAHKKLDELGYDLTYEESQGDHQWKYWDEKIQTVLSWLPIRK